MNIEEVLEQIRCALINLDNLATATQSIRLADFVYFKIVKMQLEEAEKLLVTAP